MPYSLTRRDETQSARAALTAPHAASGTTELSSSQASPQCIVAARHAPRRCDGLQGRRVVIVEDEGITQLQLQKMLRNTGAAIVGTAANGRAGVEVVLRERPDIVLMDIQMPLMNGLDAAEEILSHLCVCILMLSAYSDAECQHRARNIGAC